MRNIPGARAGQFRSGKDNIDYPYEYNRDYLVIFTRFVENFFWYWEISKGGSGAHGSRQNKMNGQGETSLAVHLSDGA
jgi:hypothetical protein